MEHVSPQQVGSSRTRDRTDVSRPGRRPPWSVLDIRRGVAQTGLFRGRPELDASEHGGVQAAAWRWSSLGALVIAYVLEDGWPPLYPPPLIPSCTCPLPQRPCPTPRLCPHLAQPVVSWQAGCPIPFLEFGSSNLGLDVICVLLQDWGPGGGGV